MLAVFVAAAAPRAADAIELGAYTPGAPADARILAEYADMVGRKPDIVGWYRDFSQPLLEAREIANLRATGQTPMVTWEPHAVSLVGIASGAYDAYLHESAAIAKGWEGPLLMRFAHEMNGGWYSWGSGAVAPATYVAAWQHIVSIFREDGAANVSWVWSPYVLAGGKYPIAPYFPGDEWIDYVGLDGYNWGEARGAWQSLQTVFAASYSLVTELSLRPVIIAETGSSEIGGDKAAWIKAGFMSAIPQSFPRVSAVVWFNEAREDDWRIDSSPAALDAYRSVVNCSIYGGSGPCEGGGEGRLTVRSVRVPPLQNGVVRGSVSYALSDPALVQIKIVPLRRTARMVSILHSSHAGRNRVPLARIFHRRHLHVGRYRVVLSASNQQERSRRHAVHFRVVDGASGKGPRHRVVGARLRLGRSRR
jgi:Glycosyl hydrolase family 26